MEFKKKSPNVLAVKLTKTAENIVKRGHPWVFSESILKIDKEATTGDICILFGNKYNTLYAVGIYDKESPIQIKILERKAVKIDDLFFRERFLQAFEIRHSLINKETNSYRLLYGENDYLPGIIVDVYDKVAVLKLYTTAWIPYLESIIEGISNHKIIETIVLRFGRNVQKNLQGKIEDGTVIYGSLLDEEVSFIEYGVKFNANVVKGHKTGFFLDHRLNRKRVRELARGKTVLDVFSYAGGFSIHALVGGAKEVTSVDISEQALQVAKENAKLNQFSGKYNTLAGDAFEILHRLIEDGSRFDVIIIDPPSFAKRKEENQRAKEKYIELAKLGSQLIHKNGVLVLASCSSRVSEEEFFRCHEIAFSQMKVKMKLFDITHHDIDHPVVFEEGKYLKCGYYRRIK